MKEQKEKSTIAKIIKKSTIKRYAQMLTGIALLAFSYNIFILPNNFVYGGVSGVAIIAKRIFNIEPSIFIFIVSAILLVISYFTLGKEKTTASIIGSLVYPIFVHLTSNIRIYLDFNASQPLLSALFGGVLSGLGIGLVFKTGFTSGGTDIVEQIISKYCRTTMGKAIILCDGLILLSGTFVFGINNFMYALIVLYLISVLSDKVLLGISDSKAFYIVTEKDIEVKEFILNKLSHGVTIFKAKGGHDNKNKKVLFCVIPTKEYFKLKEGIANIDREAFFVVTDAYEVYGGE